MTITEGEQQYFEILKCMMSVNTRLNLTDARRYLHSMYDEYGGDQNWMLKAEMDYLKKNPTRLRSMILNIANDPDFRYQGTYKHYAKCLLAKDATRKQKEFQKRKSKRAKDKAMVELSVLPEMGRFPGGDDYRKSKRQFQTLQSSQFGRKIKTGPKGGKYYMKKGKRVYVK